MTDSIRNYSEYVFSPTWRMSVVEKSASLTDALKAISSSGSLVACFVDPETDALEGILTDSDVRRALLGGAALTDYAISFACSNPTTAHVSSDSEKLKDLASRTNKREIPLVDSAGRLRDIFVLGIHERRQNLSEVSSHALQSTLPHDHAAFILAGGLGLRLREHIPDRPKPLAPVGGVPIIHHLITQLYRSGFRKIFISLNYRAEVIREYVASQFRSISDLSIEYLLETQRLGTAGSLAMLDQQSSSPLLVCNADILTSLAFSEVIREHQALEASITCVVHPHQVSVPYGVVDLSAKGISGIREKPRLQFYVNTGIYVVEREVMGLVPKGTRFDMPDLIKLVLLEKGESSVVPFMMHEYWLDIGTPLDFDKANRDYNELFLGNERPLSRYIVQSNSASEA